MNIATHDILLHENTLCVSERLLTDVCGVSAKYLATKARHLYRTKVQSQEAPNCTWKYTKVDGRFYYDFDCLPKKKSDALGNKAELIALCENLQQDAQKTAHQSTKNAILSWIQARTDMRNATYFQYDAPFTFNVEKAQQMARAKAWLDFIIERIDR